MHQVKANSYCARRQALGERPPGDGRCRVQSCAARCFQPQCLSVWPPAYPSSNLAAVPLLSLQVAETQPPEILERIKAPPKTNDPVIKAEQLPNFDGLIFGFPTRWVVQLGRERRVILAPEHSLAGAGQPAKQRVTCDLVRRRARPVEYACLARPPCHCNVQAFSMLSTMRRVVTPCA
jgi:hypothetical protein